MISVVRHTTITLRSPDFPNHLGSQPQSCVLINVSAASSDIDPRSRPYIWLHCRPVCGGRMSMSIVVQFGPGLQEEDANMGEHLLKNYIAGGRWSWQMVIFPCLGKTQTCQSWPSFLLKLDRSTTSHGTNHHNIISGPTAQVFTVFLSV